MIDVFDGDGIDPDERNHAFWNSAPVCQFECQAVRSNGDNRYAFYFGESETDAMVIEFELMDYIGKPTRLMVSNTTGLQLGKERQTTTYCIDGFVRSVRNLKGSIHVECVP